MSTCGAKATALIASRKSKGDIEDEDAFLIKSPERINT